MIFMIILYSCLLFSLSLHTCRGKEERSWTEKHRLSPPITGQPTWPFPEHSSSPKRVHQWRKQQEVSILLPPSPLPNLAPSYRLPCHCLAVLPCTFRYGSGGGTGGRGNRINLPSKGSALEIAEAYKMKKREENRHLLRDDERHKAKKLTKMINSSHDHGKASGRHLSPLPVSVVWVVVYVVAVVSQPCSYH